MRLAVRKSPWRGLEEGTVVDGYVVDAAPDVHTRAEVLYAVTAPDGGAATLVGPRHPYADRLRSFRVRRLARLRMELTHSALIPLRAVGEYEGQPYLVTDVQPQRTFDDLLEEKAPHESELLLAMLRPVAEALDLAHSHGLVHEELSGESLLLDGDGLMLDSFGLFASGWEAKWDSVPVDDVRYRSPEQMFGEPFGPAANVYSLTALVVHLLTGAPPYQGPRPAVIYGHQAEPPPRVSERRPELGAAVDEVIAWGMAKDPSERPPSAMALLEAVDEALGGTVPAGLPRPAVRRAGRRRGSAVLAAVVAAAAACGALAAVVIEPFGGGETSQPAAVADAPAVRQLAARRADLRAELASAKTPQDQAAAARQLASAYDGAARALASNRVAAAAGTAADAYSDLAAAGEANDASGYSDAADAVAGAERRLSVVTRH